MLNFQRKLGVWGETPLMTKNVSFWSKTVKKKNTTIVRVSANHSRVLLCSVTL